MTRNEARAAGETLYVTGHPCVRGHTAPRYVSTGNCVQCHADRQQVKTRPSQAKPAVERREAVAVLRAVSVPRKHLRAVLSFIAALMAQEGLKPGPDPHER